MVPSLLPLIFNLFLGFVSTICVCSHVLFSVYIICFVCPMHECKLCSLVASVQRRNVGAYVR